MCTLEVKEEFYKTYIPWNIHEPEEGIFDFGGNKDVERFVELTGDMGLYVILDAENLAMEVKELLKRASINLYMFQGGTNFGFYNGCSARGYTDLPQITSYNYDAILTGWGETAAIGECADTFLIAGTSVEKGRNEIIIFETEGRTAGTLSLEDRPYYAALE